jgi:predicted ATP-binding protein involved in virulence
MVGMYLRECLIENIGPMTIFDVSFGFDATGNPKPVILVGKNGTGKTIVLAYILDALCELAKLHFTDVVMGQQRIESPFIKTTQARLTAALCAVTASACWNSRTRKSGSLTWRRLGRLIVAAMRPG